MSARITLTRPWFSNRVLRAYYRDDAEAGIAWVERRKAGILAAFTSVSVDIGCPGVTGYCVKRRFRYRGRHRSERRIVASIPARYPYATVHVVTQAPIPLASASKALVFILGHETAHVIESSERHCEARGLRWLDEYRHEAQAPRAKEEQ